MSSQIERGLVKTSFGYIHYRTAGSGTPIILLHINQQSSAFYIELIQALSPHARPIAIDFPSHGMSDHIPQPAVDDYARCVKEVMDALKIDKAIVLGEATGAATTVQFAAAYPDRILRAVLVNCPYTDAMPKRDATVAEFTDYRPADESGFPLTRTIAFMLAKDPVHSPMHPTQDWMDRINRAQMEAGRDRWQALSSLTYFSIAEALARVKCPVLFLIGEHFYHRQYLPELTRDLADPEVHILEGGRFCAGWEKADEIGRHVQRLLEPANA